MSSTVKELLKPVIWPALPALGWLEYRISLKSHERWGGPFNGQTYRRLLFDELVRRLKPAAIVETGTYIGTTTESMSATKLPVFSVESSPRYYGFAKARLRHHPNVRLLYGDSRTSLRRLFDRGLQPLLGHCLVIYLDAHWGRDLPLAEELDVVFAQCKRAVVMIDDFQVPFDNGYGYDDYGAGSALTEVYMDAAIACHGLCVLYPSKPNSAEDGSRRGCVVVAREAVYGDVLRSFPLLKMSPRHASARKAG